VGLNAFGIVVSDMKTSLDFYRRLGLDIPSGAEAEDHVDADLGGGVRVMFDSARLIKQNDPDWSAPTGSRVGLAVQMESPAEVDNKYAEMTGAGYTGGKEPWDAFWGQRYATLKDPDGIPVDLYAPL
jgi:uncharacterized glyoxalase superfamily protein PhnB